MKNNGQGDGNPGIPPGSGLFDEVRCYFDVDGVTIEAGGSKLSGREYVRVDGRVVSERRSFRFSSRHRFSHGGHTYEVLFCVMSIWGRLLVQLSRDGVVIDSDEVEQLPVDASGRLRTWGIFKAIAFGAVVGYALGAVLGPLVAALILSLR